VPGLSPQKFPDVEFAEGKLPVLGVCWHSLSSFAKYRDLSASAATLLALTEADNATAADREM
jgi:hypothetical protein